MAGPYYVDLGVHYHDAPTNAGTTGAPFQGLAGFQRALAVVAAGEAINIKNSTTPTYADATKLWKITFGGTTGTLALGDLVLDVQDVADGDPANTGQGYICYVESTTVVWIEVTAGTWAAGANHYLWKDASNYGNGAITAALATAPISKTAGTATGPIKILGCANDSSWTNDGNRIIGWDGQATGQPAGLLRIDHNYYIVENLSLTRCSTDRGIYMNGHYGRVQNCKATLSGHSNFLGLGNCVQFEGCESALAVLDGFNPYGGGGTCRDCVSYTNGRYGIRAEENSAYVVSCLVYANVSDGVYLPGRGALVIGSVIDGNKENGILAPGPVSGYIMGNRITHNGDTATEYGINAPTGSGLFEDYNVFYNNGSTGGLHHTGTISAPTTHSLTAASIAECGYTDAAYQFNYNNGVGTVFTVDEVITKDGGGWSATITAVTDSGATGTLTVSGFSGGMPATGNTFTATGAGKHAHVNGTWTVTKAAGTGTPNYNLLLAAIGRRMSVSLDGTNNVILSAGLTPPPVPPSSAGNVLVAETAYESATGTSVAGTNVGCPTDKALYTGTPYYGAGGTENDGRVYECPQDKALDQGLAFYGVDGTEKDGNWRAPDGNAVLHYGYNWWGLNTAYDGNFVEPGVAHVQNGWTYGVSNSLVGTYAGGGGGGARPIGAGGLCG